MVYVHKARNKKEGHAMADAILNYNPEGNYKVRAYDVTYREDQDGAWLARIYQPEGAGPFPALIDVHGGAWNRGGYTNNELIDQTLASFRRGRQGPRCRTDV